MLWHFDELSEFARSGHGGFNATSASGQNEKTRNEHMSAGLPPCVDGSELARTFFTYAELVGAPMCSAF